MTKKYKIDLNTMLSAIDNNDMEFFDSLDAEQQKAFEPWLAMRYASSAKKEPEHHLICVNELVNRDFNALSKHPKMQWMLLSMVGLGAKEYHPFVPPSKKAKKDGLHAMLSEMNPMMNADEINILIQCSEKDELRDMLESYGFEDKEIKKVLK